MLNEYPNVQQISKHKNKSQSSVRSQAHILLNGCHVTRPVKTFGTSGTTCWLFSHLNLLTDACS